MPRGRQGQARVGARLQGQPAVGVDGGRAVDRVHDGELSAIVSRLEQEVGVGDLGDGRVHHPDHEIVRQEPFVARPADMGHAEGQGRAEVQVADLGPVVGQGGAHHPEEAVARGVGRAVVEMRAEILNDGLGPVLDGDVDEFLRDLMDRLIPRDAPPFALAARAGPLHRRGQPGRAVHDFRIAGALLASSGIEIGHAGFGGLVVGRLFLADDDAVLDIDVPVAGAAAVQPAVGALGHAVPGPALAVEVFPGPKLGRVDRLGGFGFLEMAEGQSGRQRRDAGEIRNERLSSLVVLMPEVPPISGRAGRP